MATKKRLARELIWFICVPLVGFFIGFAYSKGIEDGIGLAFIFLFLFYVIRFTVWMIKRISKGGAKY